ncbi:type II toxin-antitoxin system RelE/ParE family toxin [Acetobacterium malicum]|uniref:type II toxin-antitoxin system RelE/ParE family toxin n=1 Tax=Acetobacterium malicum TaxID=52692 RepID=UPI00047EEE5F|nr:type II toxin-antitoxin system RelE/ParE family toxin [Acetobacterium dehalogenans]
MIYEIEITEQADDDLREIFEYLAVEVQSPQNASGQLDRLEESIMKLDQLPERFRTYDKEPWRSRGLRIMPVDNYCVFYIQDESNHIVTIIRVLYGSRNIEKQLR